MGPLLFADTSFYIALMWPRDPDHTRAVAWQEFLLRRRLRSVTTEAVLWEMLSAFSPAPVRQRAFQAYQRLRFDLHTEVVNFYGALNERAIALYGSRADKNWSAVDCLSFIVMQDRGLGEALTSDHHFEQAGFTALLLQDPPT